MTLSPLNNSGINSYVWNARKLSRQNVVDEVVGNQQLRPRRQKVQAEKLYKPQHHQNRLAEWPGTRLTRKKNQSPVPPIPSPEHYSMAMLPASVLGTTIK